MGFVHVLNFGLFAQKMRQDKKKTARGERFLSKLMPEACHSVNLLVFLTFYRGVIKHACHSVNLLVFLTSAFLMDNKFL